MCEWACCHGGETNCFSSTCLDFCVKRPPSATSKPHSKTCHWWFDQGGTNSLCTMPWMSEENYQHGLDIAVNLIRFFQLRWIWRLPLLLSLRVITIHPCFFTGYAIVDEVGIISGLCFEFPADRSTKGLLVLAQQSWHKSRRNVSHVQIVRQNALNGPIWQSYYLTNILDSLPTICKDSLANFCYVFRCCACRRSSRKLIVVNRSLSVLEAFVP